MRVEYQLTAEDLFAFQWRAVYRSAAGRRGRKKLLALLFLVVLLIAILPAIGPGGFVLSRVSWILLVTGFPVFAALYMAIERWRLRYAIRALIRREKPERGQLGRHVIELSDAGLKESTAVGESWTEWSGIDRVEQDAEYIYIYTSAVAAHVVPRRAFAPAESERFYEMAAARWQREDTSRPTV